MLALEAFSPTRIFFVAASFLIRIHQNSRGLFSDKNFLAHFPSPCRESKMENYKISQKKTTSYGVKTKKYVKSGLRKGARSFSVSRCGRTVAEVAEVAEVLMVDENTVRRYFQVWKSMEFKG